MEQSPVLIGKYRLFDPIAAGGMATVHYGRLLGDGRFARTVAIKRLHAHVAASSESVYSLLDEARLAARIRHINVIPTLDVVLLGTEALAVMEYVPGETLARALSLSVASEFMPLPVVAAIVSGMLRGLHAAHEALSDQGEPLGIVHRDVSPQNILIGTDGVARVLDFGIAKAEGRLATTTLDGRLKGKLAYMSPEQLGGGRVDRRTDVFAAGIVLWESLTNRRLFRGRNEGEILNRVLSLEIPPPSTFRQGGEPLDRVALRATQRHPDQRFQTAAEFADAVEAEVAPAPPSVVSAWLEQIAGRLLRERAQRVAEIERLPDEAPGSAGTANRAAVSGGGASMREATPGSGAAPAAAASSPRSEISHLVSDREAATRTDHAIDTKPAPVASSHGRRWWLAAPVVLALVGAGVLALTLRSPASTVNAGPSEGSSATSEVGPSAAFAPASTEASAHAAKESITVEPLGASSVAVSADGRASGSPPGQATAAGTSSQAPAAPPIVGNKPLGQPPAGQGTVAATASSAMDCKLRLMGDPPIYRRPPGCPK